MVEVSCDLCHFVGQRFTNRDELIQSEWVCINRSMIINTIYVCPECVKLINKENRNRT